MKNSLIRDRIMASIFKNDESKKENYTV